MNNNTLTRDPNNFDFSKLKLIGYYKSASPKLNPESIYREQACELARLLDDSLSASECISSLDSSFYSDIIHSVLIFKNYHGHLFAYLPTTGTARISNVQFSKDAITYVPAEHKMYFAPGEPFVGTGYHRNTVQLQKAVGVTKVMLNVIRVVRKDDLLHYEVSYGGTLCYIRLLPFQVEMTERGSIPQQIACVYKGLDEYGEPKLSQDRNALIDDLYEEDTVHTFSYIRTEIDYHSDAHAEYHIMRDGYGLKHRLYAQLTEEQKIHGSRVDVYVRGINNKNKTLILSLFNPKLDKLEKVFFSADKVFEEIDELENKEQYFDCYFTTEDKHAPKLQQDLVGQYNGGSNLWLFTYMNILDTIVIGTCIRKHQIEELAIVCQIMMKLQEWMVEGSKFLDLFGEETKSTTITKSTAQIQKFHRLLLAIDVVRKGEQNKYIRDIVSSIQKSGRIAISREERIEVMIDILRIYPDYFTQDIEDTSELIQALLSLQEGVGKFEIEFLASRLDYYIEADVRKMRAGAVRSNEIDTTQTILIKEVLALLCMKVMIHISEKYANELDARACKARFFRFLSFVCPEDMQPIMIKAGIDALVGVIDGSNIFTWENATNVNPIALCNQTAHATILDCNTENDFYFMKSAGKTGIIRLDPTGFTIVPYKQCANNFKMNSEFMENINVVHHLETLPIKLGTMLNISPIVMERDAVNQYLLWRAVSKHPENLAQRFELSTPRMGDKVRVCVKEQNQSDKLKYMLFVSVVDKRFASVDGILTPKDITGKWVEDTRKLFKVGQVFYAEVCNITENGKYQFSIRKDVEKYSTTVSRVEDDVKHIVENCVSIDDLPMLSKSFVQELILLVDMRIRKESNPMHRLILIGYAYCLSALASDPKSYYYDFLLRYYAALDKFITNEHQDVDIKFNDTINSKFVNVVNKRRLVELLSYANNQNGDGLQTLQKLSEEEGGNDAGKLAAMLMAYIYASKAGFSPEAMIGIKKEINNFVGNSDKLDLSALDSDSEVTEDIEEETNDGVSIDEEDVTEANQEQSTKIEDELPEIEDILTETSETSEISIPNKELLPLKLNFLDDGNLYITEDTYKSDGLNSIVDISLPTYAFNGVVLLVNNDGGISKLNAKDIANCQIQTKIDCKLNPYKIINHFVVPTECVVGNILSTEGGKYVEIYKTEDIPASDLNNPVFKRKENFAVVRQQPFILPNCCEIPGLHDCFGKCIESKEISEEIIQGMHSYGVFI